ncbi:MAG: leucine-rich repeat protein [Clostridia bacterium]|nr:leucine-rich repeat protein [Clostridia bacterium]
MKRGLSLLLTLALLLSALSVFTFSTVAATTGSCGTNVTYAFDEATGTLTISGSGQMANYSDGGTPWYANRYKIYTIIVESGVTRIGNYAFAGCSYLNDVTLPEGLTVIGSYSFAGCRALTKIILPESLTTINMLAFYSCSSLVEITLPKAVSALGSNPFYDTPALERINVAEDNAYLCEQNGVLFNKAMTVLIACPGNKTGAYTVPDSVKQIAVNAFTFCKKLTGIKLPKNLTSINGAAFSYCYQLTVMRIPEGITSLPSYLFLRDSALKTLYIPSSVTSIDSTILNYTGDVTIYGYSGTAAETFASGKGFSFVAVDELPTSGNCGSTASYTFDAKTGLLTISGTGAVTQNPWLSYIDLIDAIMIEEGITSISVGGAFAGADLLKTVTLPDSLTYLGNSAITDCPQLETVHIPAGLTTLLQSNFTGCPGLTAFTADEENFNFSAENGILFNKDKSTLWRYPAALTGFYALPETVDQLDLYAFSDTSLSWLQISNPDVTIRSRAFADAADSFFLLGLADSTAEKYAEANDLTFGAYTGSCGPDATYYFDAPTATMTISGTGYTEHKNSTLLYPWASFRDHVKKIVVEAGITELGNSNFSYFRNLTTAQLPNSLTAISSSLFMNCSSLTTISCSDQLESIGSSAFNSCSSLASFTIPETVTSIGGNAFTGCSKLKAITVPASVTSLGGGAFSNCSALSSLTVDEANTAYCSKSNIVYNIAKTALIACTPAKTGILIVPQTVTEIGPSAFSSCSGLTAIILPAGLRTVGGSAFSGCSALTTLTIPEGVRELPINCIDNCAALTSVSIPSTVDTISTNFSNCPKLTDIQISADNPFFCSINGDLLNKKGTTLIMVAPGKTGAYIIPEGVTSLYNGLFNSKLTSIHIPKSLRNFTKYTITSSYGLTEITVAEDHPTLKAEGKFLYSRDGSVLYLALTTLSGDVVIPEGVTEIAASAFSSCTNITSLTLPDSLTTIGNEAFAGCRKVPSITIPANVSSIGVGVFSRNVAMTEIKVAEENPYLSAQDGVLFDYEKESLIIYPLGKAGEYTVPEGVKTIKSYAFDSISNLTALTLPETLEVLESHAINSCQQITSIYLPASVNTLYYDSLYNYNLTEVQVAEENETYCSIDGIVYDEAVTTAILCPNGKTGAVTIPEGVTTINDSVFYSRRNITEFRLPNSLTSIGNSSFSSTNLTELILPESLVSIGERAFFGTYLKTISLPKNVQTLATNALYITSLTDIFVDDSNPYFCDVDGVLFSKDQTILLQYPANRIEDTSYALPEGTVSIGNNAFIASDFQELHLPASFTEFDPVTFCQATCLKTITVAENNPAFCAVDGVLFSKDQTTLLRFPYARSGAYTVPEGVTKIGTNAFCHCHYLEEVTLPCSLQTICEQAFFGSKLISLSIPGNVTLIEKDALVGIRKEVFIPKNAQLGGNTYASSDTLTVYGYSGSSAERYTEKTGLRFVDVEKLQPLAGAITNPANKTYFMPGDELITDGLEVTWNYSDTIAERQLNDFNITGYDPNQTGTQTVTVTRGDISLNYQVTVQELDTSATIELLQILLGAESNANRELLDQNGDGKLTISDAIALMRKLAA